MADGTPQNTAQLDLEGGRADVWQEISGLKRELAAVKARSDGQPYHGNPWWIVRRTEVLRLIDHKVAVCLEDVFGDLWFQNDGCFATPTQWDRGIRRFVRNAQRAEGDTSILFSFLVPGKGRGVWYIARLNEAHCAVDEGVRRMHMKDSRAAGQIARRLKEQYQAQVPCERCKKDAEKMAQ